MPADGGWLDVAGDDRPLAARQDRFGFVETESKEPIGAVIEWLVDHSTSRVAQENNAAAIVEHLVQMAEQVVIRVGAGTRSPRTRTPRQSEHAAHQEPA